MNNLLDMPKSLKLYIYTGILVLLCSCSAQKFIPEGEYLLDKVRIESDTKQVHPSSFTPYIRQNPNARWFNLVKVPMGIYCLSGRDSSKSFNQFLRKLGDEPVIYESAVAKKSQIEIEKAVRNMGYMQAKVSMDTIIRKHKLELVYKIKAGKPYKVGSISYDVNDAVISEFIKNDSANSLISSGMTFNVEALNNERNRITSILQNNGYYKFNKDFLVYQADTARNTFLVDLTMKLLPYQRRKEDVPMPHQQYTIRNVNYIADDNSNMSERKFERYDFMYYDGINLFYKDDLYIRPNVLANFNHIHTGDLYSEQKVQNTITAMGRMRALKYTNINFHEIMVNDSAQLDANVVLTKGKNQSMSFEIEGTNSAGDLGAAASLTYQHRNIFRGSETFTFKVRGAYETITGLQEGYESDDYKEYGIETSLNFPEFKFPFLSQNFKRKIRATSEVGIKFNSQLRPEFIRTLASAAWSYRWSDKSRSQHRFDLLDVNYVYVPWKSDNFNAYLNNLSERNSILIKSYEDQLIVSMGYSYIYNSAQNQKGNAKKRNSYSLRVNLEEGGNLLRTASKIVRLNMRDERGYIIGNIPFAQYVKGDFDFAHHWNIDKRNSLVFHIGLGIAYPYGNSQVLPFEKRYFSGGPNSVRGWSVRSLGPGSYKGAEGSLNYINHTGDIKIDMNIEYRTHLFWKLNGAAFIDAGNIWNIRNYEGQEEGTFQFARFYKQFAVAYGLGIRFDLDFLILRFDGGMKAIDPIYGGGDKISFLKPNFKRDFTFHFAVGYPF